MIPFLLIFLALPGVCVGCETIVIDFDAPQVSPIYEKTVDFVKIYDEYTWINSHNLSHTITSGTPYTGPSNYFDSDLLLPGDEFSFIFEIEGEFNYFCLVHPWETAILMVVDDSIKPISDPVETPDDITALQEENAKLKQDLAELQQAYDQLRLLVLEQLKVIYDWVLQR